MLVATWGDGVFVFSGPNRDRELVDHSISALADDGRGGAIAIVDGNWLDRRTAEGVWNVIATTEFHLACCVAMGDVLYAGTSDANVLRVSAVGEIEQLRGFESVRGRHKWYAGTAVVDGKVVGPPLGVRSITATSDGAVLLANVHVGGIPRSLDGGITWEPTIDVNSDVHEVRAHPNRPGLVAAAAAVGLCISTDGGATWSVEKGGLHASHCAAVAFTGDGVLVSAAADPFAAEAAIYRRRLDADGPLVMVAGGLPAWLDGLADTRCIAAKGSIVGFADKEGNLYVSHDSGQTWRRRADGIPDPSSVLII